MMPKSGPSRAELIADGVIHAIGLALGLVGSVVLVVVAAMQGSIRGLAPVMVYAICLLAMLGCSAAYNIFKQSRHRPLLRRLDHAAIFAMIAGTYTPFTILGLTGYWSWGLTAAVWSAAGLGIVAKLRRWRWPDWLWIPLYLVIGWLVVVAFGPLSNALAGLTLVLLAAGGVLYTIGVGFHLWERLKFQNAVWHGFVLLAAATHYAAVVMVLAAP